MKRAQQNEKQELMAKVIAFSSASLLSLFGFYHLLNIFDHTIEAKSMTIMEIEEKLERWKDLRTAEPVSPQGAQALNATIPKSKFMDISEPEARQTQKISNKALKTEKKAKPKPARISGLMKVHDAKGEIEHRALLNGSWLQEGDAQHNQKLLYLGKESALVLKKGKRKNIPMPSTSFTVIRDE